MTGASGPSPVYTSYWEGTEITQSQSDTVRQQAVLDITEDRGTRLEDTQIYTVIGDYELYEFRAQLPAGGSVYTV